jgi:hypothetical protein
VALSNTLLSTRTWISSSELYQQLLTTLKPFTNSTSQSFLSRIKYALVVLLLLVGGYGTEQRM